MEEILIYISRSLYVRGEGGGGCELELIVSDFFLSFGKRWEVAKIKRKKVLAPPFLLLLLFLSPTSRLAFWVKEERSGKSFSSFSRKKGEEKELGAKG